jgi:phospholipid N-methyltransferase
MSRAAPLFIRQFIKDPRSVGAVFPSSQALARAMLHPVDFSRAGSVVEFGPGTGSFTQAIRERLSPAGHYLGIERDAAFCARLRHDFPGFAFAEGSIAELEKFLDQHGIGTIDAVISGIPWSILPVELQDNVLPATARRLRPGGVFVTFSYVHSLPLPAAQALRQRLRKYFADVRLSPIVWGNLLPAVCYICRTAVA